MFLFKFVFQAFSERSSNFDEDLILDNTGNYSTKISSITFYDLDWYNGKDDSCNIAKSLPKDIAFHSNPIPEAVVSFHFSEQKNLS